MEWVGLENPLCALERIGILIKPTVPFYFCIAKELEKALRRPVKSRTKSADLAGSTFLDK